jgi:hypothetical protein
VPARDLAGDGMDGAQIGEALRRKRQQAISRFKSEFGGTAA